MTAAAFGRTFRSSLASIFIDSQETTNISPWQLGMSLEIGTRVEYQGKVYISVIAGNYSQSLPPTHGSGISDGLLFLHNKIGQLGIDPNIYLFVGKPSEWESNDAEIEPVDLGDVKQNEIIHDIIGLKKLKRIDTAFCVRRYDWSSGEYYKMYSDTGIQEEPFYVLNRSRNIYKCIDNNGNSPSTIEPSGTSSSPVLYGDGYVWKYMATVDPKDAVMFLSHNYIPLRYKLIDDGSAQYITQISAKKQGVSAFKILSKTADTDFEDPLNVIEGDGSECDSYIIKDETGTVNQVIVSDPGYGYKTRPRLIIKESSSAGSGFAGTVVISESGTVTGVTIESNGSGYSGGAVAFIVGNGTGAVVECSVELGVITGINIIEVGQGYTEADVVVVPGFRAIIAEGILSPRLGHGHNVLEELGVNVISINATIPQNEYFPEDLSFRQIGLIGGAYDDRGSMLGEEYYAGPAHNSPDSLRKLNPDTGNILYLNNIEKVERIYGQEERLKIIIEF